MRATDTDNQLLIQDAHRSWEALQALYTELEGVDAQLEAMDDPNVLHPDTFRKPPYTAKYHALRSQAFTLRMSIRSLQRRLDERVHHLEQRLGESNRTVWIYVKRGY